jgi:hypothetical protein
MRRRGGGVRWYGSNRRSDEVVVARAAREPLGAVLEVDVPSHEVDAVHDRAEISPRAAKEPVAIRSWGDDGRVSLLIPQAKEFRGTLPETLQKLIDRELS